MKQKKIVLMIGVLVLVIGTMAMFAGCKQSHNNETTPVVLEKQAVIILESQTQVTVTAETVNNEDMIVEGCEETYIESGEYYTKLNPIGTKIVIKGDITSLKFDENSQITSLDVRGLTSLEKLECPGNKLESLDVQGLTQLEELNCRDNQLGSLNVQGLKNLKILTCDGNKLTSLNVQGLTKLEELWCDSNGKDDNHGIESLDLSGLTSLRELSCGWNKMKTLIVHDLPQLSTIQSQNNLLTSLDLSNLPLLRMLLINVNQIETIDLTGAPNVDDFDCGNNRIKSLDISVLKKLTTASFYKNEIESIKLEGLPKLTRVKCYANKLGKDEIETMFSKLPNWTGVTFSAYQKPAIFLYTIENGVTDNNYEFTESTAYDGIKGHNWKILKAKADNNDSDVEEL